MINVYGGDTLDFDWQGKVNFTLHDLDGKEILHDSFHLKGEDSIILMMKHDFNSEMNSSGLPDMK